MPDRIDASLLGRRYVPDDHDYRLEDYLAATDPLDTALAALVASNCNTAVKAWAKVVTPYLKIPAPAPPPAPATDVVWADADAVLDQGQTPHCFPAETLVRLANGSSKPIAEVDLLDIVVTGEGFLSWVSQTMARPFSGELVRLRL